MRFTVKTEVAAPGMRTIPTVAVPSMGRKRDDGSDDGVIARRSAYTLMGRVVMAACRGLGLVLVSRAIGASSFGEYSLVLASYAIASALGTLGLDQAYVHYVGSGQRSLPSLLRNAVWASVGLGILTGSLLLVGAHLLRESIFNGTPGRALQMTALVMPGVLFQNSLSGMTIGRSWFRYHGLVESGKWMLYLLLIAVFSARGHLTITMALLALYIPVLLAGIVHLGALLKGAATAAATAMWGPPEWEGMRMVASYGIRACTINITHALHMRLDVYLIKYLLESSAVVGQYALAVSITDVLLYLGRSIGLVVFAQRSAHPSLISQAGPRVARVAAGVVLASAILLVGCIEPLVRVLFGPEFRATTGAVLFRLPGLVAETVSFVLAGELLGLARMRSVFLPTASAVGVGGALNLLLVPAGGIAAAAASFSIASWLRLGLLTRSHRQASGHPLLDYLRTSSWRAQPAMARVSELSEDLEEVRS
jgi:O-antigen/teichoic acid export membrane protein